MKRNEYVALFSLIPIEKFITEIVTYIVGYIVRQTVQHLLCSNCIDLLIVRITACVPSPTQR